MVIRAKLVVAVATTLTAVSALLVPAFPAHAAGPDRQTDLALIEHWQVAAMAEFQLARLAAQPPWLDWTNDGCSTPSPLGLGDTGRSYNFRRACQRHDFGYRNTKLYDRRYGTHTWNTANRQWIDNILLADMLADCAPRRFTQRFTCRAWAHIYYTAVRLAGGP
jgi:Prokaryotic phospholipase A2